MFRPKMHLKHLLILGWSLFLTIAVSRKDIMVEGASTTTSRILIPPKNLTVIEGDRVNMNCTVDDGSAGIQWAINGLVIGYMAALNRAARVRVNYSKHDPTFSEITIANVSLRDEGYIECQVPPSKGRIKERQKAYLEVLAPPKNISIHGLNKNYRKGEEVELTCKADGAKPIAELTWFFNDQKVVNGTRHLIFNEEEPYIDPKTHMTVLEGDTSTNLRYTTLSTLQFVAKEEDDYAEYTCQVTHPTKGKNRAMRTSAMLSVLYPPKKPQIEGFDPTFGPMAGTTISVKCVSYGGNPPAALTWLKNNQIISRQFKTKMRKSESRLNITLQPNDHEAKYRCEASNSMLTDPAYAVITTKVLYYPENMTIKGPKMVRAGQSVTLTCVSAPSNPPVDITWFKDDEYQVIKYQSKSNYQLPDGWLAKANFTFQPNPEQTNVRITCRGTHPRGMIVETTYNVSVIQPPKSIMITGHESSDNLVSGARIRLLCVVTGGNPPPNLTWYKNNIKNESTTEHTGSTTTSALEILVDPTDNDVTYRCDAYNIGVIHPLSKSVELNVKFPPEAVDISMIPSVAIVGTQVRIHCDSSSSNPQALVSLWRNGIPVKAQLMSNQKGLFGGTLSSVEAIINVTKELDRSSFICQASNGLQNNAVYNSMIVRVEYPPEINNVSKKEFTGTEGQSLEIKLEANGNPDDFTWTWSKNGLPITLASRKKSSDRIISDGGTLMMTPVSRYDAGEYTVEVLNSRGASTTNITVNVKFAAEIINLKQVDIPKLNGDAILACHCDGNPLTAEHIRWDREGGDINPKMVSFANKTSYLLIEKASREDIQYFYCIVNNGIEPYRQNEIMLRIQIPPEIDSSPKYLKYATKVGQSAKLTCISKAEPMPTFTWRRNGSGIAVNVTKKFITQINKIDPITYVNTLHINDVSSSDFGLYDCTARNHMGNTNQTMQLNVLGPPDPVISLNVTNVTSESMTIKWVPGFNGGMTTRYRVRYRPIDEVGYSTMDVINSTQTTFTLDNLKRSKTYVVSIMAFNDVGQSNYLPDDTIATTLASSEVGELNVVATQYVEADVSKSVVVYVSIAAALLVIVNAALVACFVFKRRARRLKDNSSDPSKSQAIEMYAPPSSYNDTVTGETVSDTSMPFGIDHDDRGSLPEVPPRDMHQPSETFVTEQDIIQSSDYPPNYAMYEGDHHARTLPHAHKHKEFTGHTTLGRNAGRSVYVPSPSPMPPIDGSYCSMLNDRYLSYPPVIQEFLPHQRGTRTPTPPHQYATTCHPKHLVNSGGAGGNPSAQHKQMSDPLGSYFLDVHHDRPIGGGTLRRRPELNLGPPPDVTVMHQGNCSQHHLPPTPGPVKHPQSILKDPSRHKYGNNTFGSPLSSSSPHNNSSSQILAVHNLSEIPQYGTIRKENKKQNVSIDEGYNIRNDNVV